MNKILQRTVLRRNFSSICLRCVYIFLIFISILASSIALNFPSPYSFFHLSSPALGSMLTYEEDRLGIVMQYPSDWEKIAGLDGFVTFIAPRESASTTYPAGIGLRVEELSSRTVSLEEITRVQIENLTQSYPDFDPIESSATTLAGNPAHKTEFTATDDKEEKRKAIQIWTLKDDKAYLFTHKADPKNYSAYLQAV